MTKTPFTSVTRPDLKTYAAQWTLDYIRSTPSHIDHQLLKERERAAREKAKWDALYAEPDYFAAAADIVQAEPTYTEGCLTRRQAS